MKIFITIAITLCCLFVFATNRQYRLSIDARNAVIAMIEDVDQPREPELDIQSQKVVKVTGECVVEHAMQYQSFIYTSLDLWPTKKTDAQMRDVLQNHVLADCKEETLEKMAVAGASSESLEKVRQMLDRNIKLAPLANQKTKPEA